MAKVFTFGRQQKIRVSKDYKRLFTRGKKTSGSFCRLYVRFEKGDRQMGVVISRKIKGSVIRNRYKRLIREYFRLHQHQLKVGTKIVIFVATKFQPARYEMVEKELGQLFESTKIKASV